MARPATATSPAGWACRCAAELEEREDGLLDLAGRADPEPPPPRLLSAFDPLLLGRTSREVIEHGVAANRDSS